MMSSKSLAILAVAFPSHAFAFRPNPFRKRALRRHDGCNFHQRVVAVPTKLSSTTTTIPVLSNGSHHSNDALPPTPVGVVFDMDGTLVQHAINFADMRRRIHAVADVDPVGKDLERDCVLALSGKLSPEGRAACDAIFADIERRALDEMELMKGGVDLVRFLGENGLRSAVLTRNLERNVAFMRDLYFDDIRRTASSESSGGADGYMKSVFYPIVARDTKSDPSDKEPIRSKPHPDGILHICNVWNCDPAQVIMVGDSANDDMTAANRAGCGGAVLLTQPGGRQLDTDSGYEVGNSEEEIRERTPSLRVESLGELKMCLEALLKERDGMLEDGGDPQKNSINKSNSVPLV